MRWVGHVAPMCPTVSASKQFMAIIIEAQTDKMTAPVKVLNV